MKKQNLLLTLGAVACFALTSCGQKEITISEAKELAKSASTFETSDFNFIKVSTTITKWDATSGSASIYKELFIKYGQLEVGKTTVETYQYKEAYTGYVISKEAIEGYEELGATGLKFYQDGNKLSVSYELNEEQKFTLDKEYTFKIATKLTSNFNENGYLVSSSSSIDMTFTDNSTCSQVIEEKVEWVK